MKRKIDTVRSKLRESVSFIRSNIQVRPRIAVILGSGLGEFGQTLSDKTVVETSAIPHYPHPTVVGHQGRLVVGKLQQSSLCVLQGRVHFYETGNLETVLYPIRVLHGLGIKILIVTNAAGGVNREFNPGDLMLIEDQINLTFENPLKDFELPLANRELYDKKLRETISIVAQEKGIKLRRGVYCGLKGPSYETAAEVEMIQRIGADAVGMSTVNEVSLANALGMKVAGISCITNLSTGITGEKLSHAEVTDVANKVKVTFGELLQGIIKRTG